MAQVLAIKPNMLQVGKVAGRPTVSAVKKFSSLLWDGKFTLFEPKAPPKLNAFPVNAPKAAGGVLTKSGLGPLAMLAFFAIAIRKMLEGIRPKLKAKA